MLTHRLQVLIDETRHQRLEAEAARRGVAIAVLVREALDLGFPATDAERRAAGGRVLDADPMPVPDVDNLRNEIAALRGRRA